MEVEVKLRLKDAHAHTILAEALKDYYKATHDQENFFFDGCNGELNQRRIALRIRFYNGDQRCRLTSKGRMVMSDGIGKATEEEEDIDCSLGRQSLENPALLLSHSASPIIAKLKEVAGGFPQGLACLGGFRNTRNEFSWNGLLLELDETKYEWGTVYELECETPEPEKVRDKLEALLTQNGVQFTYSTTTKFANFRNKTLE